MKRNKLNERMIQKNVQHTQYKKRARMANQTPNAKAKKWFDSPAYQAQNMIKEQAKHCSIKESRAEALHIKNLINERIF